MWWSVVLHDGVWWWYVMLCVSVWWSVVMCGGGLALIVCGSVDAGDGSAVPFPILARFGPNKNCDMHNTICKNQPYQTTNSEHPPTANVIKLN